tara:strand:- start:416 stop:778 length:363 start_codon:yes stop_codon:yes gene_type:complete
MSKDGLILEPQKPIPNCLVPGCETEAKTRGLCSTHYMYAHRLVTRGQTTWPELERQGKCLPSHSNPSPTKDWFLNGVGEDTVQEEKEPLNAGSSELIADVEWKEPDPNQAELDLNAEEEA